MTNPTLRKGACDRKTSETTVSARITLDRSGEACVSTGIGFLDHMLVTLSRHSGIDINLSAQGDLEVDDHHTAEDCALALGAAIDRALGDRLNLVRFGWALAPMDEALARVAIDLSSRPCSAINLGLARPSIGSIATENIEHFFTSLATSLRGALHVDLLRGENDHHKAEAAFKALALALRQACALRETGSASVKGAL